MDRTALVVGCGYVGTEFALLWAENGGTAYGARRRPEGLPSPILAVPVDVNAPGALEGVPDLDLIVYAVSAGGRAEGTYRAAYVDGVQSVLRALGSRIGPDTRGLFVSSTAVYGVDEGEVDESTLAEPTTATARILREGERVFEAAFGASGAIVRLSGIYGPGRTRLVRGVLEGGPLDPPNEVVGNRIHREDCARLLLAAATADALPPVVVGVDDATVPLGEVRAFVAGLAGRDPAAFVPVGPPRGKRLRSRTRAGLGFTLAVPSYREGYPAIVHEVLSGR